MEIEGDVKTIRLNQKQIDNLQIPGFFPVILNITPVTSLPLLLGKIPEQQPLASAVAR